MYVLSIKNIHLLENEEKKTCLKQFLYVYVEDGLGEHTVDHRLAVKQQVGYLA